MWSGLQSEPLSLEADLLKVLGHPVRLRVLQVLEREETCVCDLIQVTGVEQSNLSQHLKLLRKHGIVATRRDGTKIMYRLTNPSVMQVLEAAVQAVQVHLDQLAALAATRRMQ